MITAEKSDTISVGPMDREFRYIDGSRLVPRAEIRIHAGVADHERKVILKWIQSGHIQAFANMTSEEFVLATMRM
jgi:hypothetical protein